MTFVCKQCLQQCRPASQQPSAWRWGFSMLFVQGVSLWSRPPLYARASSQIIFWRRIALCEVCLRSRWRGESPSGCTKRLRCCGSAPFPTHLGLRCFSALDSPVWKFQLNPLKCCVGEPFPTWKNGYIYKAYQSLLSETSEYTFRFRASFAGFIQLHSCVISAQV